MSLRFVFALCAAALLVQDAGLAQGQDDQMNARDAFWSAADLVDKRPVKNDRFPCRCAGEEVSRADCGKLAPQNESGTELPPKTTASVKTPSAPAHNLPSFAFRIMPRSVCGTHC